MAIGDIGAVIDDLEFDTDLAQHSKILNLGSAFAVFYSGASNVGTIKTYPIANDGTIGTVIDSGTFDTTADWVDVLHVSGDIYAIVYQGTDGDGLLKTIEIGTGGSIGSVAETLEFDATDCLSPKIIHVSGTVYALIYQGPDQDGWVKTINIDVDGTNLSVIDTHEFTTNWTRWPSIIHITGTVYLLTYNDATAGTGELITIDITNAGTIGSNYDTQEFDAAGGAQLQIAHVFSTVYAVVYYDANSDGWVKTFTVSVAGIIALVDSLEWNIYQALEPSILLLSNDGTDSIFAFAYRAVNDVGTIKTLPVGNDGSMGAIETIIDTLIFDATYGSYPHMVHVYEDIFAVVYIDTDIDGQLKTFDVESNLIVVNTYECTNTIAEKSSGWGSITSLGSSAITQHGHCWSTTINPTTSDSKTSLGAKPNLGQFLSHMTGLTPGTTYYVRAYATNTGGTAYGLNVTITTGGTIGRRHIWTEKEYFHYFGESGTERKVKGDAVTSDRDIWYWI